MTLIWDEYDCIWVWVATNEHDIELSPRFDTEEDAQEWYSTIRKIFKGK